VLADASWSILAHMRIPGHADHDSGVMAITIPG
jgi:hypothetical protein